MTDVLVYCDRCKKQIAGAYQTPTMTAGFYNLREGGDWFDYAKRGERNICDACMWADPDYIADYGSPGDPMNDCVTISTLQILSGEQHPVRACR